MIQAGRDLKRDRAYGKEEGRGLWKKSSIGEKIGSKVLAWGGAWLWKELLAGRPIREMESCYFST